MPKTSRPIYKDPSKPIAQRVEDLLSRMTLDEKIHQACGMAVAGWITNPPEFVMLKNGKFQLKNALRLTEKCIGGFSEIVRYLSPEEGARLVNRIQEHALKKTRLGIPVLIVDEALHGCSAANCTAFPQAIGWASTWDEDLAYRMGRVINRECRLRGITQLLSPILDISRDPRWGRTEECLGEDPHLISRLGIGYVRGIQNDSGRNGVISTLKHYGIHNSPEGGLNIGPTVADPRTVRDILLRPFEAVVKEAKPLSVMSAYSEWDGIPASANKWLLSDMLRDQWGFNGFVVSDYGSITMLADRHAVASDYADAGAQAMTAGVDMELPKIQCFGELAGKIRSGAIPEVLIDRAVRRILRVKFALGLFENPYASPLDAVRISDCTAHRQVALEAARKSIVLLKNDRKTLPIPKTARRIAVIGPNADAIRIGNYGTSGTRIVTALEGIRKLAPRGTSIIHTKGCEIYGGDTSGFADAMRIAENADIAILVIGEVSDWGAQNPNPICGEGYDSDSITLAGHQLELVKEICRVQKNVVVVLYNGRPLATPWIKENVPAIVEAWYPGEEGGTALAEILFGRTNPSGRLPITIPATVGQLPVYYNHKPAARGFDKHPGTPDKPGRDYVFASPEPLFRFGHGLSYTTFKYSGLKVAPAKILAGESVTVSVDVKNTGRMAGEEVVQLYVRDCLASVTRPVKELRGFKRIRLTPGAKKKVSMTLRSSDLEFHDRRMNRVVEPGMFEVMVGGNSIDMIKTTFAIVDDRGKTSAAGGRKQSLSTAEMGWH